MGLELVSTKIVVLTLLGVLRLVFGLLPLKITKHLKLWGSGGHRRHQVDRVISLCLCFGGGVLMATCFIHMIPEVRASLDIVIKSDSSFIPSGTTFPLAELFICCGFFLVYILEETAHFFFAGTHHHVSSASSHQCVSIAETASRPHEEVSTKNGQASRTSAKIAPASSQVRLMASSLSLAHECGGDVESLQRQKHDHCNGIPRPEHDEQSLGNMRNFLVVLALSFHSVFEGLAIGLQPTEGDVWYLFTAVSIHASTILFCVGLEMATSTTKCLYIIIAMFVLAMVSPLGVVIGILATLDPTADSDAHSLAVALLQGIAGGTILYITFFEVLTREKKKEDGSGFIRVLFVLLGFLLMVVLQIYGSHAHGECDDHSASSNHSAVGHLEHGHERST